METDVSPVPMKDIHERMFLEFRGSKDNKKRIGLVMREPENGVVEVVVNWSTWHIWGSSILRIVPYEEMQAKARKQAEKLAAPKVRRPRKTAQMSLPFEEQGAR